MRKKKGDTKLNKPSYRAATWTPTQVHRLLTALRPGFHILKNRKPVRCDDTLAWAKWMFLNPEKRLVAKTAVGPYRVSTVFLGIDHRPDQPPPVLFETMIFNANFQRTVSSGTFPSRYATWDKAKAGHDAEVQRLKLLLGLQSPTSAVTERHPKPPRHKRRTQDQRHKATRQRVRQRNRIERAKLSSGTER